MPKIPHMRFFVADYLTDTVHLTTEEHGAYLLLLFHYWQTEKPLNNKGGRLASVVKLSDARWKEMSKALAPFFKIKRDIWHHGRVEYELELVMRRSSQASYAASEGARKRANERLLGGRSASAQRPIVGDKDIDRDKDSNSKGDFERFAEIYPNLGNRKSALREFIKASLRVPVTEIIDGALKYANDPNRDQTHTYLAANWLKDDRWNDPALPARANKSGDVPFVPAPRPQRIIEEVVELTDAQKANIAQTQKDIRERLTAQRIESKRTPTEKEGK